MARENNIGENIKKYRTKQGLSQEDFAKKSGVKYTTLTKIESGIIKKPSVLPMAKIAKTLGVNIEELILKKFCADILETYEKYNINGHIIWKR